MKTKMNLSGLLFVIMLVSSSCTKEPMACCEVPTTGTVGVSVSFSSTCSMDASKYEWNFGDGSAVSTEANPTHIYTTAGTYSVKLMVMDKKGKNMKDTSKAITIN